MFGERMKPENVKCPDCDGPMVSRTGKFGVFWGCKAFPNCKGTRDSMGRSKADREAWKREKAQKKVKSMRKVCHLMVILSLNGIRND